MIWSTNTSVTKIFSRYTNILRQRHQISNIFWSLAQTKMGLQVSLNYPGTNVQKMVRLKNVWMRHCSGTEWEGGIKVFLKGRGVNEARIVEKGGIKTLCKLRYGFIVHRNIFCIKIFMRNYRRN